MSIKKIGILGGGQLGRMLLQAAANYVTETFILENDDQCPAAHLCHHFIKGNITNYNDVYAFGKMVDVLTIEIENVNIEALEKLEQEGLKIIPTVHTIKTIKNKITQKHFYAQHNIPTSAFVITQTLAEVNQHISFLPAVHKIGEGGYDGKGVAIINTETCINKGFDAPSVLEKKVDIYKEIAVIVATDQAGNSTTYPATEMIVNPTLNLLDYQLTPARLKEETANTCTNIALQVAKAFNTAGLLAVEFLVDNNLNVWVNETAPRVHNSGHHSIEAQYCSQFDMLIRIMLNLPLGSTATIKPSVIMNLIGEEGYSGEAKYSYLQPLLQQQGVFVHLYGKAISKPGRKMGHVTILANTEEEVLTKAAQIKQLL